MVKSFVSLWFPFFTYLLLIVFSTFFMDDRPVGRMLHCPVILGTGTLAELFVDIQLPITLPCAK